MASNESIFKCSVTEAVAAVSTQGQFMLVLLLPKEGMGDLLESAAARAAVGALPVKALRLRAGETDTSNFVDMFPDATCPCCLLVGPGGRVAGKLGEDDMDEARILDLLRTVPNPHDAAPTFPAQQQRAAAAHASGSAPQTAAAAPVEVSTAAELDSYIATASHSTPVVIDWYADWCGPCRAVAPAYAALASDFAGKVVFLKANSDHLKPEASAHGVTALPTFQGYANGKMKWEVKGADLEKVRGFLNRMTAETVKIDWGDAADSRPAAGASVQGKAAPVEKMSSNEGIVKERDERRRVMMEKVEKERRRREEEDRRNDAKELAAKNRFKPRQPRTAEATDSEPAPAVHSRPKPQPKPQTQAAVPGPPAPVPAPHAPVSSRATAGTSRLSIRLLSGENIRKTFTPEQTLDDVRTELTIYETGRYAFATNVPKRKFDSSEEGLTLKDVGLVPSGTLILVPVGEHAEASPSGSWFSYAASWLSPSSYFTSTVATPPPELGTDAPAAAATQPQRPGGPSNPRVRRIGDLDDEDREDRNNGNGTLQF
ncbi:Thioredoxin H-type [Diplonema papillatum]|nr:Thioredoxin H-type [Diplonema papillatum]KAJ9451147.1 Thioredoxin H-type [Diplonema papillatum]